MSSRILYLPELEDLLYLTTEKEISAAMGMREELVALLAFKEIDSVAPALSSPERELLYDRLIRSPVIPYICSFRVRGLPVKLPIPQADHVYEKLCEIEVDEFNITQILKAFREGYMPRLHTLTLYVTRPLEMDLRHLSMLRSLTLENQSDELHPLPNLNGLALNKLILKGYILELQGTLPRSLTLHYCVVKDSLGLKGCERMYLVATRWAREISGVVVMAPSSFPSISLSVEQGNLVGQPPETLEELTIVNSSIGNVSLVLLPKLHTLRLDLDEGHGIPNIEFVFPANLETLILATDMNQISLPNSVSHLHVSRTFPSSLPGRLVEMDLHAIDIDQRNLFTNLPRTIISLVLVSCRFMTNDDILEGHIPQTLRILKFIACSDAIHLGIQPPQSLGELIVLGMYPKIRDDVALFDEEGRLMNRRLQIQTPYMLMDLREFRLHCLAQASKRAFDDFEACYLDVFAGDRWKPYEELLEYANTMFAYPFRIAEPRSMIVARDIIHHAHSQTAIRIGTTYYNIGDIRSLIHAGPESRTRIEPRLQRFIQGIREAPV